MPAEEPEPEDRAEGADLRWRVNRRLTAVKVGGAVVFLIATIFTSDPVGVVIGVGAAAILAGLALRDLLAPVRLAADPGGVTVVTGFAGHRHLGWAEIDRIRVNERRRLGARSQLLEIDTGTTLHLFSGYELSASCAEVAARLERLRARAA